MVEVPGPVRAGLDAVAAADASVVVDEDEPVVPLVRREHGAHGDAGRVVAVVAEQGEVPGAGLRVLPDLGVPDPGPEDALLHVVLVLARDRASPAANAPAEVDDHRPAVVHFVASREGVVVLRVAALGEHGPRLGHQQARARRRADEERGPALQEFPSIEPTVAGIRPTSRLPRHALPPASSWPGGRWAGEA